MKLNPSKCVFGVTAKKFLGFMVSQKGKRAMSSPEAVERIALWAIELSEFDVQYRPRTAVKGQIVADFIAEYT